MSLRSFSSPETHFNIVPSRSPPSVDSLAITEPKCLQCAECGAQVQIDGSEETQTTIDDLPHDCGCSQHDVVSEWWEEQFVNC